MRPTVLRVICVCMDLYGGSKDPAKTTQTNAAWAPGKYAHTHTQRDGDDDNDGALSTRLVLGLGVRASREQESCVQCATHTLAGRCRARRERRRCCRRSS